MTHWNRATQLPPVLASFERNLYTHVLISKLGIPDLNPTFVQWATQCQGTTSSRKCYETLETYGDTILKLSATLLAYDRLQADEKAGESKVARMKDSFVTNMFLYKIGKNLELNKFMRAKDPEPKNWSPPFTRQALSIENLSCTGKNIADGVESLLGAIFMSTNLFQTFRFISEIQLVPL